MKKRIIPTTESVLDVLAQVDKKAKKGNIPQALSKNASLEDRMKYYLCKLFVRFVVKNEIKAVHLSQILKLPKTRVSDILNYKTEKYSVDRLLSYAWRLAEADAPTKEHIHLMLEVLSSPVRTVKETKRIEKQLLKYA